MKNLAKWKGPLTFNNLYDEAFDELNVASNEHSNLIVYYNCKFETKKLDEMVLKKWKIQSKTNYIVR